jgi:hypothetical protein
MITTHPVSTEPAAVPVVFDTPAAATACFNVAPLARAVKNLIRTSADFGFLPNVLLLIVRRSA